VDHETIALRRQRLLGAADSFSGGTLHIGRSAFVERDAHEVVGSGVADVELDTRVDGGQVDEIGRQTCLSLGRRRRGQGPLAQSGWVGADSLVNSLARLGAEIVEGQWLAVQANRALLQDQLTAARDRVTTTA
jgi:hypothetical protein